MAQPYEFEEPKEGGDRFSAEQARNRRLIVVPIEYVPTIRTQRGTEVDGIRINVVDLDSDGSGAPAVYYGALWFGGNLIKVFKTNTGKMFLGYVNKEPTGGGFEKWVFHSLTQDQQTVQMAQAYLGAHPEFMETSQGDVRYAQANPQPPPQAAEQPGQWQPQEQPAQWQTPPPPIFSQPPVPAAPAAPAPAATPAPPGQQSVMDRLKAQRESGNGFENGPAPF